MADNNPQDPRDVNRVREYLSKSLEGEALNKRMQELSKNTKEFNRELQNARTEAAKLNSTFSDLRDTWRNVIEDVKNFSDLSKRVNSTFKSFERISEQLALDYEDLDRLSESQLKAMQKKALIQFSNLKREREELALKFRNISEERLQSIAQNNRNKKLAESAKQWIEIRELVDETGQLSFKETNYLLKTLDLLNKRSVKEEMINRTLGLSGKIVEGMVSSLERFGVSSKFFETLKEDMREAAESGSKFKVMWTGVKGIFSGIGEALRDPLSLSIMIFQTFKKIYSIATEYQAKVYEAAKNLGMGVTEAGKLFTRLQNAAQASSDLAFTGKQFATSLAQMNDSFGFMGPISEEFLITTTGIQRRLGVSAEEMQNMQLFSATTGKTLKDTYATIIATSKMQGISLGFQMSEKQVLQAISKVSATVFNNFKGNVQQLTIAVMKATKLGLTLDSINQSGMQMLDFESSISKQFEAQLLTGRNIDLSMARQYALTGNTEKLMGEITRQLGSQAEWNKMNVIQQQSLAEAMGMSKESVDEMYRKQQLTSVLGKEANADAISQYNALVAQGKTRTEIFNLMGQQAAQDALAASVQEKMAATMERINDNLGNMAQSLMPIIDGFANILGNASSLKILMGGIAVIAAGMAVSSMIVVKSKQQQLSLQIQLQLIEARQLLTTLAGAEAEALKASIMSVEAGAAVTAGSGYLGPGAVAVGLAAISALMGYLAMTGAGGTGGGGTNTAYVPAPPASMSPMNAQTVGMGQGTQSSGIRSVANERPANVYVVAQMAMDPKVAVSTLDQRSQNDSSKMFTA